MKTDSVSRDADPSLKPHHVAEHASLETHSVSRDADPSLKQYYAYQAKLGQLSFGQ